MDHRSRILAAVDLEAPARSAFDHALALARRHGAELVVVQAVPPDQPFNREGRERLALRTRLERLAGEVQVPLAYRVQHGDPAEIILLHAQSVRPDVIVVGSHQRRGLDRWRAGSVSERVIAGATVPVLMVPARGRADTVGAFRHVAVAVDLAAGSDAIVERALAAARGPDDRVTLLHVVPGYSSGVPPNLYRFGVAEHQSQLVRDARRSLLLAVPARRESRAAVHTRVLRGDTSTALSRGVTDIGADLLIVGVPRRGIVARSLFGSTAARLLQVIDVPLLAVPAVGLRAERQETVARARARAA